LLLIVGEKLRELTVGGGGGVVELLGGGGSAVVGGHGESAPDAASSGRAGLETASWYHSFGTFNTENTNRQKNGQNRGKRKIFIPKRRFG